MESIEVSLYFDLPALYNVTATIDESAYKCELNPTATGCTTSSERRLKSTMDYLYGPDATTDEKEEIKVE